MVKVVIELKDKPWWKSKTVWTAVGVIVAEILNYYLDTNITPEQIALVGGALITIFLRQAVGNNGKGKK